MGKLYDLIPSQQNIYMLVKFSFHKQIVQIPASFAVDADIDFDLLARALNVEFSRNDSTRLRFVQTKEGVKQYFLDAFRMEHVPVLHFSTKEAQENFFEKEKGLWKREKRNERKKIIKIGLYERKRNR